MPLIAGTSSASLEAGISAGSAPARERPLIGRARIDHPETPSTVRTGHAAATKPSTVGARLLVDQVIDVALAIHGDRLWCCDAGATGAKSPSCRNSAQEAFSRAPGAHIFDELRSRRCPSGCRSEMVAGAHRAETDPWKLSRLLGEIIADFWRNVHA